MTSPQRRGLVRLSRSGPPCEESVREWRLHHDLISEQRTERTEVVISTLLCLLLGNEIVEHLTFTYRTVHTEARSLGDCDGEDCSRRATRGQKMGVTMATSTHPDTRVFVSMITPIF